MSHYMVPHVTNRRNAACPAQAVMAHVQRLLKAGIAPQDIGIITPYNAQVGAWELRQACDGLGFHNPEHITITIT